MGFKVNDYVRIKKYPKNGSDGYGRVVGILPDGRYWVSNMNMPFCGNVNDYFQEQDLEQ